MKVRLAHSVWFVTAALTLGHAGVAPASPDEIYGPSSGRAVGTMLLVHGGAWNGTGQDQLDKLHPVVARMRGRGWGVVNMDYRAGGEESMVDVLRAYDRARARTPAGLPVCTYGESAGGHMVLLLAEMRNVQCTVAAAAPVDLLNWASYNSDPNRQAGADYGQSLGRAAFGDDPKHLRLYSPIFHANHLHGRVLLVNADNDMLVPKAMAGRLAAAAPAGRVRAVTLAAGGVHFVHSNVSAQSLGAFKAVERMLMSKIVRESRAHRAVAAATNSAAAP